MSIILEVDNPDVDIESTSVEDSFMILNDDGVDEANLPDDSAPASESEESQSESSDSSFLDIDLDDEIEDQQIDTPQSVELDEHQVNQELEEVSSVWFR